MKRGSVYFRFAFFVFFFIVIAGVVFCFIDRIAAFSINHLTDYRIFYDKWGSSPFNRSDIQDLRFDVLKNGFAVTAKTAHFDLRFRESINARKLILDCRLQDVRFLRNSGSSDPATQSMFTVPFDPDWHYISIVFSIIYGGGDLKIKGFRALADDIKLNGESQLNNASGDFKVDLKMSVSPQIAEVLMGDFREILLVPEENGWFGTKMSLEGNVKEETFHMKSETLEIRIRSKEEV